MSRLLFSMLDSTYSAPGRIQHSAIKSFAEARGYEIGFYGAEDPEFREDSPYLFAKLKSLAPKYDGIVFYSALQLRGNCIATIRSILMEEMTVLFAAQQLELSSVKDLETTKPLFLAAAFSQVNRDLLQGLTKSLFMPQ